MSHNGPDRNKVLLGPSDFNKCSTCDTNQGQIDDVEQNLSGRDQIVSLLQNRLKKCETNYKGLFDDFEKLRFDHCTALQENYSLKKINSKLEEIERKSKCNDLKYSCSHHSASISNHLDNKRIQESNSPIIKEVNNIENLVYSQNQILKQLLDRIVTELGFCHCDSQNISEKYIKLREDFPNIESGDHVNTDPKVKKLLDQLESCKTRLDKCQEENECMKKLLNDRKSNFSDCQNILQHTSRSINQISISIDDLVKKKTMPKETKEVSCCTEGSEVDMIPDLGEKMCTNVVEQMQTELKQKEQEYQICKCQMFNQLQDISDNNQILSETLEIMKAENKNNLETVDKLKEELRRVNEECESKQKELKARIDELDNLLEESHLQEKKLLSALNNMNDTTNIRTEMMTVVEGRSECKFKNKLDELECSCGEMQKDISEKAVELSEYEEENRALNQKIESLTTTNDNLRKIIEEFEEQWAKQPPELQNHYGSHQSPTDDGRSKEGGRCLGDDCILGQRQKLKEIDSLTNTLQQRETEMEKLIRENADLRLQMEQRGENNEPGKQYHFGQSEEAGRCLDDDCSHMQILKEIESLTNAGKKQAEEIEQLKKENAQLRQSKGRQSCDTPETSTEYGCSEKEGRYLGDDGRLGQMQKLKEIESLNNMVKKHLEEIEQLREENAQLRQSKETGKQSDYDNRKTSIEYGHFDEEGGCVSNCCKLDKMQKSKEVESLKNIVKEKAEKIKELNDENDDLRHKLEGQRNENKKETEKLQAMVNHSQQQVELLLKEHDEKTEEIQNVANELDSIRRSVNEENNSFCMKICELEKERDELQKVVEECKRKSLLETGPLKAEISRKQQVVLELEKTIDSCNENMKQFEINIESLACENSCLKSENEQNFKDLQDLRKSLGAKVLEIEAMQEQLAILHRDNDKRSRESISSQKEKEKIKNEMDNLAREEQRIRKALETQKLEHQMELASLKDEHSTKTAALLGKIESCQKASEEARNECARKCFENNKLLENIENNKKVSRELKEMNQNLQDQCEKLKNANRASMEETHKLGDKMSDIQERAEKLTKQYTTKCMENDELQSNITEHKKEHSKMVKNCEMLCKKLTDSTNELTHVNEKYNNMQKEFDEKCIELKKVKKQWESSCKQSEITRDEYNNLRKEYKEIKVMLSDQIKKYKKDTDTVNANEIKPNTCKIISELKSELVEKDQQIMILQEKLKDSSYEIIELKDYVHKLISDNNILKSAINNLIGNLERKIKGSSSKSLINDSADAIAGEILQSLTNIENTINKKSQSRYCTTGCSGKDCDCMSQIQSQYNKETEVDRATDADIAGYCSDYILGKCKATNSHKVHSKDSNIIPKVTNPLESSNSRDEQCLGILPVADKGSCEHEETDVFKPTKLGSCCSGYSFGNHPFDATGGSGGCPCEVNKSLISRSDASTSESDDHCCDHMSVELLKETIEGLKGSKDKIMKRHSN